MHGRIKTRTTAEQEEIKKKERAKKVELYKAGISHAFSKRKKGENDESGLAVSAKMLAANPDIYTLWNIRREIILNLKTLRSAEEFTQLMEDELRLTEACLRTQPKSYGTWHQRCWVLDQMENAPWKAELALCDKYLSYDERNFHCWDYRRFIVQRSGVSAEEELKFTDEKIEANFSNYSAWHLRSNLLPQVYPDPEGKKPIADHQHKIEMELVTNAAFTDPYDQSAWFYQRWLLGRHTPELRVTHVEVSKTMMCIAFNQSLSPLSPNVSVNAFGDQPWATADGQPSSFVWKRVFLEGSSVSDISAIPVELVLAGQVKQSMCLKLDGEMCFYHEKTIFESGFSPGVTEVLCNVLDSCKTLLQLEPDTKWPLLTSVLLMQATNRKQYKDKTLEYLDLLAKIDHLRANYYFDLKSRYVMEYFLEEWNVMSDACLTDVGLTALYHSQRLLSARRVDLSSNQLRRSLPRLSSLQFCQILVLDRNGLETLEGFPSLPCLTSLSVKYNKLESPDQVEPFIKHCPSLVSVHIDGNPLSSTHTYQEKHLVPIK